MENNPTGLQRRIQSGQSLLLAEFSPPQGGDGALVRQQAGRFAGKVHALGVSDNRDRVAMSALAAASLVAAEGIEPILHIVTRDRNRIALVSEALGAQALGIRNLLCTSGTHQVLGAFRTARNVYDVDTVQLLQTYSGLSGNGSVVGEPGIEGAGPFCLGGTAAPYADPLELQVLRLMKKAGCGAKFLVTQPVFDLDRFHQWWDEVVRRGLHEKTAIVAGIEPLTSVEKARELAERRPRAKIPEAILARISAGADAAAQRAAGIAVAADTIERLKTVKGLRGFQICADGDVGAALEVMDRSGLDAKS
jgi:methylenetetrahydrofolate reductase (NADPH)